MRLFIQKRLWKSLTGRIPFLYFAGIDVEIFSNLTTLSDEQIRVNFLFCFVKVCLAYGIAILNNISSLAGNGVSENTVLGGGGNDSGCNCSSSSNK